MLRNGLEEEALRKGLLYQCWAACPFPCLFMESTRCASRRQITPMPPVIQGRLFAGNADKGKGSSHTVQEKKQLKKSSNTCTSPRNRMILCYGLLAKVMGSSHCWVAGVCLYLIPRRLFNTNAT